MKNSLIYLITIFLLLYSSCVSIKSDVLKYRKPCKLKIYAVPITDKTVKPILKKDIKRWATIVSEIYDSDDIEAIHEIFTTDCKEVEQGMNEHDNVRILCVFYYKNGTKQKMYIEVYGYIKIGKKKYQSKALVAKVLKHLPCGYGYDI